MNGRAIVIAVAVVAALFGAASWLKRGDAGPTEATATLSSEERDRIRAFWEAHRAATQHRIAGDVDAAIESYDRALALDPRHEDALYYAGAMYLRRGNAAAARDRWRRLITVNPVSARAHHQLGDLYMCPEYPETFDLSAAAEEFRSALTINQEETGPLLQLAEVAVARGDLDSATTLFGHVLRSNPGSQAALFYRGYAAWAAGRREAAQADFDLSVTLARPDDEAPSGLLEGETEGGGAMLAERTRCQQFGIPIRGLPAARTGRAAMDSAYAAVARILGSYAR